MLNKFANPLAENGFTMNNALVAGFPPLIGFILTACSIFCSALANPAACLLSLAPFSSAKYSLLLLNANCKSIAINGVIIAKTSKLSMFPAPSLSLPPPNIAANLAINAT